MLSKYEETSRNIIKIESVVGKLVEELGAGGFMSVKDVEEGMGVKILAKDEQDNEVECKTKVSAVTESGFNVEATQEVKNFLNQYGVRKKYEVQVVVENAIYIWKDSSFIINNDCVEVRTKSTAEVMNRRKYPRLPLDNPCEIRFKSSNEKFRGKMVNISAGGYAFASPIKSLENSVGKKIEISILGTDFLEDDDVLSGVIIRSSDNDGEFIVGCRMPIDSTMIRDYVEKELSF